jgi:hypothetical protein
MGHVHRTVEPYILHKSTSTSTVSKDDVSGQPQVSGRGPTFKITRGSFFATPAAGAVSGVDSGDDDDDDASAGSPTG